MKNLVLIIISLLSSYCFAQNCEQQHYQEFREIIDVNEVVRDIYMDSSLLKSDEYLLLIEYGLSGHIVHLFENIGGHILVKKIVKSKIVQSKIIPGHLFLSNIKPGSLYITVQLYRRHSIEWMVIKNNNGAFQLTPEFSEISEVIECLKDRKPSLYVLALKALEAKKIMYKEEIERERRHRGKKQ